MRIGRIVGMGYVAVVLGGCWAVPACAAATPAWTPPVRLSSPGHQAKEPQIGTVGTETVAVWLELEGGNWVVRESSRPRGGSFSTPVDLSKSSASASEPRLVLNRRGGAVVIWKSVEGVDQTIQVSTRRPGRELPVGSGVDPGEYSFTGPVAVSSTGPSAAEPSASINYGGKAIAVWQQSNGTNQVIRMAELNPTTLAWSSPATLSAAGGDAAEPDVALSYTDAAAIVWRRFDGTNYLAQMVTRKETGGFSEPRDLSASGAEATQPEVAIAQFEIGAIAVWRESGAGGGVEESLWRESKDEIGEASDLGGAGSAAVLQIDPDGELISWFEGSSLHERAQSGLAGEFPGPTTTVPLPGTVEQMNLSGSPEFAWRSHGGGETAIEALRSGGTQPMTIPTAGSSAGEPAVAGYEYWPDLAAIWVRPEAGKSIVEVSGLDAEGPWLSQRVYGPGHRVGEPIAFFEFQEPFDLWSKVVSTEWDLGDGTSARGAEFEHAFCAGSYTVRQTVTNALGQSTSSTSPLTIEGSNAPKVGTFQEILGSDGTGTLKVTAPCDGELSLAGAGVQPWQARLTEAGQVTIPVTAVGRGREAIEKTGQTTAELQIEFEPQGAAPERATTSVTLFGEKVPQPQPSYWTDCSTGLGPGGHVVIVHRVACDAAQRALANLNRKLRGTGRGSARSDGFLCGVHPKANWRVRCHRSGRWILSGTSS